MEKTAEELAAIEEAKAAAVILEEAKKKAEENKTKTLTFEEHQKAINEVVAERDKNKEKYRETRERLKKLEDRLEGVPSGDDLKKILDEKKLLEDYKKKIEGEKEAQRLAEATEVEKIQIQLDKIKSSYESQIASKEEESKKTVQQLQIELEKKSKETERLLGYRKESEILKAADKYNAVKPSQMVNMLSGKFVYDEEVGDFIYPIINSKGKREGEKSVEAFVKDFLEDAENDNLVKGEAKSGSGHHTTTTTTQAKKTEASKFMRSEKAILEEEAEERNLTVDEWASIKKAQEEKKKKQ